MHVWVEFLGQAPVLRRSGRFTATGQAEYIYVLDTPEGSDIRVTDYGTFRIRHDNTVRWATCACVLAPDAVALSLLGRAAAIDPGVMLHAGAGVPAPRFTEAASVRLPGINT